MDSQFNVMNHLILFNLIAIAWLSLTAYKLYRNSSNSQIGNQRETTVLLNYHNDLI